MPVVLGVGVSSAAQIADFDHALSFLEISDITTLATLSGKEKHPVIGYALKKLSIGLLTFSVEQLEQTTPMLQNPSEMVFRAIGCHGVAEAAALAACGRQGQLVCGKIKEGGVTLAIARTFDI